MNISKIGHQSINKVVLPLAAAAALTVACAKNSPTGKIKDEMTVPKEEFAAGDTVEINTQKNDKKTHNDLLYFMLGFFGVSSVIGLSQAKAKRVENDVKQTFYKNNPSIVAFEDIENAKEIEKFTKRRDKLRLYLASILNEGLDSGELYTPDIDEYMENVNKFTKYYPDRKALLTLGLRPFADSRLRPEERGFVFSYIYTKATSLNHEWLWENQFRFLTLAKSYEEIVHRMLIMRKIDAKAKQEAEIERAEEQAEAEQTARMAMQNEKTQVMFKNVGGQDKAIEIIKRKILFPIKYPKAFEGSNIEHGFVLYGPPGTGKTLLAKALSNEANAHFIKINGPELESKWVGATEENWRNIFDEARENQPSIIFIDEFDSVASQRGGGDIHGDKALNQLLGLISDIKPDEKIFILAATNRLDSIDPAFIRSGRLGTHIELKAPETLEDIKTIFSIHTNGKKFESDVKIDDFCMKLMRIAPTGSDIAYIANYAEELAKERENIYEKMDKDIFTLSDIENLAITNEDLNGALDKFKTNKFSRPKIGFDK